MRAVVGAGVSYAALFLILLTQALMGQPLIAPAGPIASALTAWAVGTLVLALMVWRVASAPVQNRSTLEVA